MAAAKQCYVYVAPSIGGFLMHHQYRAAADCRKHTTVLGVHAYKSLLGSTVCSLSWSVHKVLSVVYIYSSVNVWCLVFELCGCNMVCVILIFRFLLFWFLRIYILNDRQHVAYVITTIPVGSPRRMIFFVFFSSEFTLVTPEPPVPSRLYLPGAAGEKKALSSIYT